MIVDALTTLATLFSKHFRGYNSFILTVGVIVLIFMGYGMELQRQEQEETNAILNQLNLQITVFARDAEHMRRSIERNTTRIDDIGKKVEDLGGRFSNMEGRLDKK